MTRLQAIEESMKHWERDVIERLMNGEGRGPLGIHECALCRKYWVMEWTGCGECTNCPIVKYDKSCFNDYSAYQEFFNAERAETGKIKAAFDMWSFLCLLREIEVQGE